MARGPSSCTCISCLSITTSWEHGFVFLFSVLYSCRFLLYSTAFSFRCCYLFGYRFPQAFFLNYFFYPQPRLAMLLPRRDSRTVILGPGYVYLYIHFSLLHDCTASFPCILGLEQCLWGLGSRFRQGFTN